MMASLFLAHRSVTFQRQGWPKLSSGTRVFNALHMVKHSESSKQLLFFLLALPQICSAGHRVQSFDFSPWCFNLSFSPQKGILSHISFLHTLLLGDIFFLVKLLEFFHQRHYHSHGHDHGRTSCWVNGSMGQGIGDL